MQIKTNNVKKQKTPETLDNQGFQAFCMAGAEGLEEYISPHPCIIMCYLVFLRVYYTANKH